MSNFSLNSLEHTKRATQSLTTAMRSFSSTSVTYDFKDLILDPDQKGNSIYETYLLDEKEMPMTATTNKEELMKYFYNMVRMRRKKKKKDEPQQKENNTNEEGKYKTIVIIRIRRII